MPGRLTLLRILPLSKRERHSQRKLHLAGFGGRGSSARYISKNVIRAMLLAENTELTAPWGEKQRADKGGFVAQRVDSPKDVYLIDEGAFKATYAPIAAGRPVATAPAVSKPASTPR